MKLAYNVRKHFERFSGHAQFSFNVYKVQILLETCPKMLGNRLTRLSGHAQFSFKVYEVQTLPEQTALALIRRDKHLVWPQALHTVCSRYICPRMHMLWVIIRVQLFKASLA